MARVALEGVSKVFARSVPAVDSLSLEIDERELLVLVGPSGCGKTTTLRLIAGLERPTEGLIRIGGRVVTEMPARQRNVAMVFQNQPLYPHLTVRQNIEFGRKLQVSRVREAAVGLGIEQLLSRWPRELSGGERQRVALARAVVRNPAVFLLDEPLSNLDANLRVELRGVLRQLHSGTQAATIYVTHDQVEALTLADRIAVMDRGRVRQVGPPLEVYDRPQDRFVAGFLGSPPMNLIAGVLGEHEGKWSFVGSSLRIELSHSGSGPIEGLHRWVNQSVVLGVRPEHLQISAEGEERTESESRSARVLLVEHLGDASWIHVAGTKTPTRENCAASKLIATYPGRSTLRSGVPVVVRCELSRAHWFDGQSGARLT